jgi:hypothetical protein
MEIGWSTACKTMTAFAAIQLGAEFLLNRNTAGF